ncbi:MAG: HesA/MoeB/ThiF family protein [Desulfohalobiaceae bacterium]|nr:HesA/MoeB/ThiF family protein [Desulfohalobiaceae bacterium]
MALTPRQEERYWRNILIPEIGQSGQERISRSRVLVVGAGGLGSAALFYLASAGAGTLGILDSDRVELSNLQRQIIHGQGDIGSPKVRSAARSIAALNSEVRIEECRDWFGEANGAAIVGRYDFVVEATDNFESKFAVNDACVRQGVPFSHAGILGLTGQAMTVVPGQGACYRCIFGREPEEGQVETTREAGVLGAVAGTMGTIQAAEAVKYLIGRGELLTRRLLTFDALAMKFREVALPGPSCPVCREAGWR